MKKTTLLLALSGALWAGSLWAQPVLADGMPTRARHVHHEEHERNWSGLYFGVNLGYAWADTDWRFEDPFFAGETFSSSTDQGLLGGHVGVQHQWGRIVVGLEASWSGMAFGDSSSRGSCVPDPTFGILPIAIFSAFECDTKRVDSLFLIGPRIGLAQDHFMAYVTGGFASGRVDTRMYDRNGLFAGAAVDIDPGPAVVLGLAPAPGEFAASSRRHNGWFIGLGGEMALADRWMLGLEYIHVSLDNQNHRSADSSDAVCVVLAICLGTTGELFRRNVDTEIDMIRARLSFKFGREHRHEEPMK